MIRKLSIAVALLTTLSVSTRVLASENWPDSVDQYVLLIRKTVKTTDMDGYLAAVKNPVAREGNRALRTGSQKRELCGIHPV